MSYQVNFDTATSLFEALKKEYRIFPQRDFQNRDVIRIQILFAMTKSISQEKSFGTIVPPMPQKKW